MSKKFDTVEERRAYNRRHYMVNKANGKASEYTCVSCPEQAKEWAQLHDTDGENPDHYDPMCHKCHQKYDDRWNEEERLRVAASVKQSWEDNPDRRVFSETHIARLSEGQQRRHAHGGDANVR